MIRSSRAIPAIVLLCFFFSGLSGLVYEIVWARYLALFLGQTSFAIVAVLVAFMGGLAIGYAWLGCRADRLTKPLAFYGWLEIGIGCYALLFPLYHGVCHRAYLGWARHWAAGSASLLMLKFVFAVLLILLPTIMMGATLPALVKFVTRSLSQFRQQVGLLYFINSAGAVLGCWVAEFWWIPAFGLRQSVIAAAVINLIAGGISLLVSRWGGENELAHSEQPETAATTERRYAPEDLRLTTFVIGASGFVAMLYEVAWTRVLALGLGSSSHAFSLMLITFISGLAIGSWLITRWKRPLCALNALGAVELALASAVSVSMLFYQWLPYSFVKLTALLSRREEAFALYQLLQGAICLAVMVGPTVCLGMTLPLASRVAAVELAQTGRAVGTVFAFNTLGTVLGTLATGFALLPWLGLARTFAVGATVNLVLGLGVLGRRQWRQRPVLLAAVLPMLALGVWLGGVLFHESWQQAFTLGLWHDANPPATREQFAARQKSNRLEFYRDGPGATVSVHSFRQDGIQHLSLKINGKPDASTAEDVPTQLLLGHVPMLLRTEAQQVLVIGLGSGMTCGAVACHPNIQSIDAVEISPEVIAAARLFARHNGNVLDNPKLRIVLEDAKSFLNTTDRTYDAIISEPSNPWMAGVAGVFTREFYESCRRALRPGGVMVQWTHLYETSDETLDTILATFSSVFPHVRIFQSTTLDLLFAGAVQPLKVDWAALETRLRDPAVQPDLARIHLTRLPVLLARETVSEANGRFIPPRETKLHRDLHPILEFIAQKAFFVRREIQRWHSFDENANPRPSTLLGEYLKTNPLELADFQEYARGHFLFGLPSRRIFRSLLLRWQTEWPNSAEPIELSARLADRGSANQLEVQRLARLRDSLFQHAQADPGLLRQYAKYLMLTYRDHRSAFFVPRSSEIPSALERLLETDPAHRREYLIQLAELAWDRGDDTACLDLGQKAFDPGRSGPEPIQFPLDPKAPRQLLARMIEAHWRAGRTSEALALCQAIKEAGFVEQRTGFKDPRLEMAYRKVTATSPAADRTQSSGPR